MFLPVFSSSLKAFVICTEAELIIVTGFYLFVVCEGSCVEAEMTCVSVFLSHRLLT